MPALAPHLPAGSLSPRALRAILRTRARRMPRKLVWAPPWIDIARHALRLGSLPCTGRGHNYTWRCARRWRWRRLRGRARRGVPCERLHYAGGCTSLASACRPRGGPHDTVRPVCYPSAPRACFCVCESFGFGRERRGQWDWLANATHLSQGQRRIGTATFGVRSALTHFCCLLWSCRRCRRGWGSSTPRARSWRAT